MVRRFLAKSALSPISKSQPFKDSTAHRTVVEKHIDIEKNIIPCLKSLARHWTQLLNMFIAPLPTTVCCKKRPPTKLCSVLGIRILIANNCARSLKGSHRMGDGWIYSITFRASPFCKELKFDIVSARSFSLDSTFKSHRFCITESKTYVESYRHLLPWSTANKFLSFSI
jgi:hypothetical protein